MGRFTTSSPSPGVRGLSQESGESSPQALNFAAPDSKGRGHALTASVTRLAADVTGKGTASPLGSFLIRKRLPGGFVSEQRACEAVINAYHSQNEEFPRPCPLCNSSSFLTDAEGQRASISGRPPVFANRPWSCEQCARFFHLGCLGVHCVDDVPAKPWFHSHSCRLMFLKLEDLAEQGEQPVRYCPPPRKSGWPPILSWMRNDGKPRSEGGGQGYTCTFMTDVDQRAYLAQGPQRGPLPIVYDMLANAFPRRALMGFGNPALEHSAGKYACLCCKEGTPVACTTFNVHGDYAAQLHLLTTAANARGQGHTRAIVTALEENLKSLGVPQLLVQPRSEAFSIFAKLGFDVVHPASTKILWRRIPVAFTDSIFLGKDLTK